MSIPLALAGLVGLPILAGIYLLRTRYRPQVVSALFLWQAVAQASGGGRKRSRMQATWPLLLELLAVLLLVLAAAGPRVLAAGQRVPVVLVLDDSFSMAAQAEGVSARDRGVDAAVAELGQLGRFSAAFVLAGPEPRRLATAARDGDQVRAALEAWSPDAGGADIDAAIALARETGGPDARLLVITDRPRTVDEFAENEPQSADSQGVRWRAVGAPVANAAVVLAVRSADGAAADSVLAEVARPGAEAAETNAGGAATGATRPARVAVEVEVPGPTPADPPVGWSVVRESTVELGPGQAITLRVDLPAAAAERAVRVRVALAGDGLAADDAVVLAPGQRPAVAAASLVSDERTAAAVNAALAAAGTRRVAPSEAELIVADAALPAATVAAGAVAGVGAGAAGPAPWQLVISAPAQGEPTASYVGPFLVDESSPLADGWSLNGLFWTARSDAVVPGRPLATAGSVTLVSVEGDASSTGPVGAPVIARMNLDAARSTVLAAAAWPVLVDNLVRARRAARPGAAPANAPVGVAVSLRSGLAPVPVAVEVPSETGTTGAGEANGDANAEPGASAENDEPAAAPTPPARLRRLTDATGSPLALGAAGGDSDSGGGDAIALPLSNGAGTFAPALAGLYAVTLPDQTVARFAAVRASTVESDTTAAATSAAGTLQPDAAEAREYRDLAWALGLAALLLLCFEAWLVYGGRRAAGGSSGASAEPAPA